VFSGGSPGSSDLGGRGPSTFGGRVYDADSHLDDGHDDGPGSARRAGGPDPFGPPPELGP
jgi:hypothetical protein